MEIHRILLTGDDGYNAAGTRLLIQILREHYDLWIAGTKTQQSAVGGKVSLATGFDWRETTVDGIPTLCVEGTPGDATELAAAYFPEPFDLVISGINWGANLGTAIFGSGTVNAALRALSVGIAKKGIAMSWDLPPQFYVHTHEPTATLEPFLDYPGQAVKQLLPQIFAANFWDTDLLNINFPLAPSNKVKFTQPIMNAQEIYDYQLYQLKKSDGKNKTVPSKSQHFSYTNSRKYNKDLAAKYDVKALTDQFISITPCKYDILQEKIYTQLQDVELELK